MGKQVQAIVRATVGSPRAALILFSVSLIAAAFVFLGAGLLFLFRRSLGCQNVLFGGRLELLSALATLGGRLGRPLFFLEGPPFGLG